MTTDDVKLAVAEKHINKDSLTANRKAILLNLNIFYYFNKYFTTKFAFELPPAEISKSPGSMVNFICSL
jgi:hypothetical protein